MNIELEIKTLDCKDVEILLPMIERAENHFTEVENRTRDDQKAFQHCNAITLNGEMRRHRSSRFVVAFHDGKPIGMCVLMYFETLSPIILLDCLYVEREFRRMGVASRIVERAYELCRDNNKDLEYNVLAQNKGAVEFWDKLNEKLASVRVCSNYFVAIK